MDKISLKSLSLLEDNFGSYCHKVYCSTIKKFSAKISLNQLSESYKRHKYYNFYIESSPYHGYNNIYYQFIRVFPKYPMQFETIQEKSILTLYDNSIYHKTDLNTKSMEDLIYER